MKQLEGIVKNASKLRKVRVTCRFIRDDLTKDTMAKLVSSNKDLEYLELADAGNEGDECILRALESVEHNLSLGSIVHSKFKLKVVFGDGNDWLIADLQRKLKRILSRLANRMQLSQSIQEFMLIIDGDIQTEDIMSELQQIKNTHVVRVTDRLFLITNQDCSINGYGGNFKLDKRIN